MNRYFLVFFTFITFFSCRQTVIRSTEFSYILPAQVDDELPMVHLDKSGMDILQIVQLTKLILSDSFPNIHSLLLLKDGRLVYENYFAGRDERIGTKLGYVEHSKNDLHDCRSISKSITGACVGIAVKKGLIKSIDDPVYPYFSQYEKQFDAQKKTITIRHLLTMTSGLKWNKDISYKDPCNTELRMDMKSDPIKFILGRQMVSNPEPAVIITEEIHNYRQRSSSL